MKVVHGLWFSINLITNLPIGEQFFLGITIFMRTIDVNPQMVFTSIKELLTIFSLLNGNELKSSNSFKY
jgi:hypothetical protein